MFMLIIWLQGIWLPQHGYDFTDTPLWAGIYMLPLTVGMLIAGPTSGYLSDRFGARRFATGGMLGAAAELRRCSRCCRPTSPIPVFALVLLLMGISMGLFASPNRAAVMNSLPRGDRGAGGGMNQTFQNSAQVLSIGIFFTLMILGLAHTLPHTMSAGLEAHGVTRRRRAPRRARCRRSRSCSPRSSATTRSSSCSGRTCSPRSPHANRAVLTGRSFFPHLISAPFRAGLHEAFRSRSSPA